MGEYTYKYDPDAPPEVNVRESFKMDKIRATMGPTSDQLRRRALESTAQGNGKAVRPVLPKKTESDL